MPDALWQAAIALASELKEAPKFRGFRRAFDLADPDDDFPPRLGELTATYSPLRLHPLLLGDRLNALPATAELLQGDDDMAWLEDAVECGAAFAVAIEYLRSRLPGYPGLRLPHLRTGSPHVPQDPFFVRGFPWDPELRQLGLQLQGPPSMADLGGGDAQSLQADLLDALKERPAWTGFAAAYAALSQADLAALAELGRQFVTRVSDDAVDDGAGAYSLARYQYRDAVLAEIVTQAQGSVAEYLQAFEAADELITIVAAFLETVITTDQLLEVEPYRMAVGAGADVRSVDLAVRGDDPMLNPGETLLVRGPHELLTGIVYPTAITHHWGRLDDPGGSRMAIGGRLVTGSVT
jgi:hypothetical protein